MIGGDSAITVAPTGFSITSSLGTLAYAAATDGWSRGSWGEDDWGDDTLSIPVTGLSITGYIGSVTAAAEQGWGRETWGAEPWGDSNSPTVAVSGLSMTGSLGTLAYAAATDGWSRGSWGEDDWGDDTLSIPITGLAITGSLGVPDVYPEQGWGRQTWGSEPWGDSDNPVVQISGLSMTGVLGTLAYAAAEAGWGRDEWGYGNWGENITTVILDGLEMTTGLGEEGWGRSTWGNDAWGQRNVVDIEIGEPLTGLAITGSLGTPQINYDFKFTLSESLLLTASRGSLSINNGADHTQGLGGIPITGSVGSFPAGAPADVVQGTGTFLATMAAPAAAAGDVQRVSVTGFSITGSQGSIGGIDQISIGLAGIAITGSIGSFAITDMQVGVSGFEMTGTLGSGGVSPLGYKDVDITGNTSYTYVKHAGEL